MQAGHLLARVLGGALAGLALAGCAAASVPGPSASWAADTPTGGPQSPAPVPSQPSGWRLSARWTTTLELPGPGTWAVAAGQHGGAFPVLGETCETQFFVVRWRSEPALPVEAGWGPFPVADIPAADLVTRHLPPATSGWLSLDGCDRPLWSRAGATAGGRIVAEIERYYVSDATVSRVGGG